MADTLNSHGGPDLRRNDRFLGIMLNVTRSFVVTGLSAVIKWIGLAVPTGQVMFVRSTTGVVVLLLIAWHTQKLSKLSLRKWLSYAPRTIFSALATLCWYSALPRAPLANLSSIGYSEPIFLTLFGLFIGERVGALQWVGIAAGFAGVLIMTGPHLNWADASLIGMLLALGASIFSSLGSIAARTMSRLEDTVAVSFYFAVTNMLASSFTMGSWVTPRPREWLAFGLIGLIGTGVGLLGNAALRYAEVSRLAPLQYLGLALSVLSGYFFFSEIPEASFWVGLPLMLMPGLLAAWVAYRERCRSQAAPLPLRASSENQRP